MTMTSTPNQNAGRQPSIRHRRREDNGFFGPNSPTWKVWTSPTSVIGFKRSIIVETFDPFLAAAVDQQNGVRTNPMGRLDRTGTYFQTIAVGDSRSAIEASEILMKVHARAVGIEPISGQRYGANNPDSQLWIHVTGWHSVLYAYERYGPGPLTEQEEERYWAECAIAAELQTCDPTKVPRSRAEVRDYFAKERSRLCVSEHACSLIHYFLHPPLKHKLLWVPMKLFAVATIATIPTWMRRLGGFDQPAALDWAVRFPTRAFLRAVTPLSMRFKLADSLMPSIRPVWESALCGEPPLRNEVVTPSRARELYGTRANASPEPPKFGS
jgi:uncharacterized protein (DUF2236 family)